MSPKGAALPRRKANARAVSAAPTELLILLFAVFPGFHIGLCPHFTQGFAGVSCLKALIIRLNFDAVALTIAPHFKGIQGFLTISYTVDI